MSCNAIRSNKGHDPGRVRSKGIFGAVRRRLWDCDLDKVVGILIPLESLPGQEDTYSIWRRSLSGKEHVFILSPWQETEETQVLVFWCTSGCGEILILTVTSQLHLQAGVADEEEVTVMKPWPGFTLSTAASLGWLHYSMNWSQSWWCNSYLSEILNQCSGSLGQQRSVWDKQSPNSVWWL